MNTNIKVKAQPPSRRTVINGHSYHASFSFAVWVPHQIAVPGKAEIGGAQRNCLKVQYFAAAEATSS